MNERIWNSFLTSRDKRVLERSGFGADAGYGKRPAVLVIDATYAFCGDEPLPVEEAALRWRTACGDEAWQAIGIIGGILETARAKGVPVIYTTHTRRPDGWDRGSGHWKNVRSKEDTEPDRHSQDREAIVDEIAPEHQDIVVNKSKPSAFFSTPLMNYLTLLQVDQVIITGGSTSGCVRATAVDAYSNNLRVTVVEDAVFDRCQASHAVNLLDMQTKYADVRPASDVEAYLKGLPKGLFELPSG
ncbi:MAG: isochorismatase family protein [Rhodospirillales bacterium]|nr:isochorismatase family protein [Rhodospirillales bacterium]